MHWLISALLAVASVVVVFFTARGSGRKNAEFDALNDAIRLARRKNSEARNVRKRSSSDFDQRGLDDDYKYLRK